MSRTKRPDEAYEIESVSKAAAVLEALEGTIFEPVPVQRIINRTGFSRDFVERALKTWRLRGYAAQNDRGEWYMGNRILRLANSYGQICLAAIAKTEE
jgi:DNA-binding IclR family transcriptional regulator